MGKNTEELPNSNRSFDDDPSVLQAISIKVVSIQVHSIQIEVVSRHHQSRFDSTQPWCSQLFRGPTGAKIAIPVSQWRCIQARTVMKTLSILDCFGWNRLSDTFTKTWSGGLSYVFAVSSLPAFVVDGSKSFTFLGCSLIRIVSSTTPGSVSLVHGFTHDKSVLYLFVTPQTRSQQQTPILIHLLN